MGRLRICRENVQSQVSSQKGHGSTFSVKLPYKMRSLPISDEDVKPGCQLMQEVFFPDGLGGRPVPLPSKRRCGEYC